MSVRSFAVRARTHASTLYVRRLARRTTQRCRELIGRIYLLAIAYQSEARSDFMSTEYTAVDKTIQLATRLASIPTALSGLPAALTSLNYLKQILVTKGISLRFAKLVEEIRPGFSVDE
jgi:hypothetical protein